MSDYLDSAIEIFKLGSRTSQRRYGLPIVVTYSGGKDSDALIEVAKASGEPFEVHHSHTTCDAPETVYHIRKKFRQLELEGIKCNIEHPMYKGGHISMWTLIPEKLMPPTRLVRYCCGVLKETGCADRMIATGVRWQESTKRKTRAEFETITKDTKDSTKADYETMLMNDNTETRKIIEHCMKKNKVVCNPIISWTEKEVWDLLTDLKIKTNPLYEKGYKRVGCIGCPIGTACNRKKEFADYPKYKYLYIKSFDKMIERRKQKGLNCNWQTGEEVFLWWVEDKNIKGQLMFGDNGEITDNLIDNY